MIKKLKNNITDFIRLVYPNLCQACGKQLVRGEEIICIYCHNQLPVSRYHLDPENPVAKIFWGRLPVEHASAYLLFTKGGKVQQLMHSLKYKGVKEIAEKLGQMYAYQLLESENPFAEIELIIPIPLHKSKQRKRGFNQSEYFARGMGQVLDIPVDTKSVLRISSTRSQTGLSRIGRWSNVATMFSVKHPKQLKDKHVMLVDDVVTTGATMEACAQKILEVEGAKISIAAMAIATG